MADKAYSEAIRNIVAELCGIPASEIEGSSNLFDLGFDSILTIQMVRRIRDELDMPVSPQDLFNFPCIHDLTEVISVRKANMK